MLCAFPLVLLAPQSGIEPNYHGSKPRALPLSYCGLKGHPCSCSILPIGVLQTPRHFFRHPPPQSLEPPCRIRPGCSPGMELFGLQRPALHPLLFIGIYSVGMRLLNKIISLCNFRKWKSQENQWFLTSWPLCILIWSAFVYFAQNNYALPITLVLCFPGEIQHQMNENRNNCE